MKTVIVKKQELLHRLDVNRNLHMVNVRDLKTDRAEAIRQWMQDSLSMPKIPLNFQMKAFPEVPDHTSEYDRAITMLEMSVDDEIELTQSEFDMYVMDNWGFKSMMESTAMVYGKSGMFS